MSSAYFVTATLWGKTSRPAPRVSTLVLLAAVHMASYEITKCHMKTDMALYDITGRQYVYTVIPLPLIHPRTRLQIYIIATHSRLLFSDHMTGHVCIYTTTHCMCPY